MRRFGPILAAGVLALAPLSAAARTAWVCALAPNGVQIVCVAEAAPDAVGDTPPALRTVVNGVSFPLARDRVYTVDLWSPPTEMAFVELLARATMCHRTPDCHVTWTTPAPAR